MVHFIEDAAQGIVSCQPPLPCEDMSIEIVGGPLHGRIEEVTRLDITHAVSNDTGAVETVRSNI